MPPPGSAPPPTESAGPPTDAAPPPSAQAPAPSAIVDDAGDTRGKHFKALMASRATIIVAGILVIGCFVAGSLGVGPAIGAAAAAGAFLLVLLVVWLIARSRAETDFFNAYATGRALTYDGNRGHLPPMSPLLRRGDERYTSKTLRGVLPGGLNGSLSHYTYEVESTDSEGNRTETLYHFTIALAELPELAPYISELFMQRRSGFRFLDGAEDVFRTRQRVELESEEADRRYEIFIGSDDDMNKARQIFSPTFIVWLTEHAPDELAFELVAGVLVCNVKGHKKSAAELDSICEGSSGIARRLIAEAAEGPG
jgi:hypothetical protein